MKIEVLVKESRILLAISRVTIANKDCINIMMV